MNHLHVDTETFLAVLRATPNVTPKAKEYIIERLKRDPALGHLRAKTINSFALGWSMGILLGDPRIDNDDLMRIINEVRDLRKLPFVPVDKV